MRLNLLYDLPPEQRERLAEVLADRGVYAGEQWKPATERAHEAVASVEARPAESKRRGRPRTCTHAEMFWVNDSRHRPYCRMCNSERMARRRVAAKMKA